MEQKRIEQNAMKIGILINLFMAFSGWWVFHVTKLDALLLDGSFSFISAISCAVAIWISMSSRRKSKIFPNGHFMFEPLYAILKSLFTLTLVISVFTSSVSKITAYIKDGVGTKLVIGPIIPYAILMVVICFSLSFVYRKYNKKINNMSTILSAESKSSFIDGILSAGVGVAIIVLNFINPEGTFGFMQYIGDSIITIVFIVFSIKDPIMIVKNSFIELANGVVIDNDVKNPIISIVEKNIPESVILNECRVIKIGASFNINIYLDYKVENINMNSLRKYKEIIEQELFKVYENISINIMPI